MVKFQSDATKLEVCDYSRSLAFHLNRQIILALLTLGIDASVFIGIFEDVVSRLDSLFHGGQQALEVRAPACMRSSRARWCSCASPAVPPSACLRAALPSVHPCGRSRRQNITQICCAAVRSIRCVP